MPPVRLLVVFTFLVPFIARGSEPADDAQGPSRVVSEVQRIERLGLMDQSAAIRPFIASLSADELQELRAFLERDRTLMITESLWPGLLRAWGRIDGPAALACAQGRHTAKRVALESSAIVGWASYAPEAAWERILLLSNRGADRRYQTPLVLAVIAERDLALAIRLYQDLVPEHACLACHAENLVAVAMKLGQILNVRNGLATIPPGPARTAMFESYWETLGTYMQRDALTELATLTDPTERATAEIKLCSGWAERDPTGCFEYIFAHPDPRQAEALILPAIQVWTRGAVAEDVARVVKRLPPDLAARSLQAISGHLARINPVATLDWLASFTDNQVRTDGLAAAMWNWALSDPDAALEYMHGITDKEMRGILVWNYVRAQIRNKALRPEHLAELEYGFDENWVRRLLATIAADLSNPHINDTQFFDIEAFVDFVRRTPALQDADRTRVLESLRITPRTEQP